MESFGSFYRQQLTEYEIPLIEKNRCLGKIAIASTTVSQVEIDRTEAIRETGDYYLKVVSEPYLLNSFVADPFTCSAPWRL